MAKGHKKIMVFLQLILMVFINVGISFYAHTCLNSGEKTILFSLADDPCAEEEQALEEDGCCSSSADVDDHEDDNCCQTEQQVLQLDDLYTNYWFNSLVQLSQHAILTPLFAFSNFEVDNGLTQDEVSAWYLANAPPFYQGRSILQLIEKYTI